MSNSLALYRPSILELAREGNFRAIAFWINSLLGPYGIYIHATPSRSGQLNILVDFKQPRRREFYMALRKHLVRFICYRLWTLNSEKIRDVRIIARIAGESDILWKQSVRIVTPANREKLRKPGHPQSSSPLRTLTRRGAAWIRFQIMRSAMVSRLTVASLFLCYWLLYWELAGKHAAEQTLAAMTSSAIVVEQTDQTSTKGQLRAGTPSNVPNESSLAVLGQSIQQELVQKTVADQFAGKVVYQVKPTDGEKVIALTFDDGPWENTTEQVLDILKQNDIKATFFWVGQALQKNPEIARKVVADGHAIGNHTWRHIMENVDEVTAAEEFNNMARLIYETTGLHTNLFRPPGGNLEGSMAPYAKNQKSVITMWSAESDDYYVSAPIIVDNVLSRAQPGGIVLMHDGGGDRTQTVQALPQIITALKQQGYRFVTVPELLALQAKDETIVQPPVSNVTDPSLLEPSLNETGAGGSQENPAIVPTTDPNQVPGADTFNQFQQNSSAMPTEVPTPDSLTPNSLTPGVNESNTSDFQPNPMGAPAANPAPGEAMGTPQENPLAAPTLNQVPNPDEGLNSDSEDTLADASISNSWEL
ncbi:polysaccharide deacetylase family protein [Leptothermofonsia sp. ETS-13]|uniref:polysaccharide deacetylase family protein n=1 Tax=Leptothermofonsia sp. ETS-13 TaxID=3035696 RepID=UPI003B9FD17F